MKKDLLLLLLIILPAIAPLTQKGYFTMHDDLQTMRQLQVDNCFRDGQIPCRWVLDMGYGYGYPLFNYYPPLPYYLGHVFRLTGLQYIDVVKAVGILGFAVTATFMYLLGRQFWGRTGGYMSAVLYTYAPYHSVDFYVRAAVNEFWAMAFYPAILLSLYKLITTRNWRWVPLSAAAVACLMLSHNPMLMIFFPLAIIWVIFWWIKTKSLASFPQLVVTAIFATALSAFFTLPVIFEQKFAHVETLVIGYFNYLAHFLDIKQMFLNINWGYGSSQLGPTDTMSFAVGFVHWLIPVALIILTGFSKKLRSNRYLIWLLLMVGFGSLFMAHSKATILWQHFQPLEFLQFPWRFLTLAVFAFSFVSGAITGIFNGRFRLAFTALVITFVVLLNGNYFRPDKWLPDMTDDLKFSGQSWQLAITSGIFDYLPIYAPMPPGNPAGADLGIINGQGHFTTVTKRTNYQEYRVEITSPEAVVEIQTFYFPGWRVWFDGTEVEIDPKRDPLLGRMKFTVPAGNHRIIARFTNTPIRTIGNTLSLLAWICLLSLAGYSILKPPKTI